MKSVPIVMATAIDPVGYRYAASLQHPGGNITGLTNLGGELGSKRVELLKEAFPRISHLAALVDSTVFGSQAKSIEDAAARLKLR